MARDPPADRPLHLRWAFAKDRFAAAPETRKKIQQITSEQGTRANSCFETRIWCLEEKKAVLRRISPRFPLSAKFRPPDARFLDSISWSMILGVRGYSITPWACSSQS